VSTGLTDIHCHILPGIDDGAADWHEALAMAELAADEGIRAIVATPHQLGGYVDNRPAIIRSRSAQLQQLLAQKGIPITIYPGADVRIEPELPELIRSGQVLTLADNGRYMLLELPHETFFPLQSLLRRLAVLGVRGILSHPERNRAILRQPQLAEQIVEIGCLMQVTAGSLLGSFGPQVQRLAEWLIIEGLAHFVATDAHGSRSRRPLLGQAMDQVARLTDRETAWRLCVENPAAVVAGRGIRPNGPVERATPQRSRHWFPWRRAS